MAPFKEPKVALQGKQTNINQQQQNKTGGDLS